MCAKVALFQGATDSEVFLLSVEGSMRVAMCAHLSTHRGPILVFLASLFPKHTS